MESTGEAKQVKHLRELLQEQQEPFVLDVYLSERGYAPRRGSMSYGEVGKKQKRKRTGWFSKLLTGLCDRMVAIHGGNKNKQQSRDREGECGGVCRDNRETAELDRFSSASSSTVYYSCSNSDPDEKPHPVRGARVPLDRRSSHQYDEPREVEVNQVETNIQWRPRNNIKLQPSIAPEITSDTSAEQYGNKSWRQDLQVFSAWQEADDSTCRLGLPKKITEDSLSSASAFEILYHCKQDRTSFAQSTQPLGLKASPNYLNSRRVLQQTKQLLFDCVKEVIETYRRKDNAGKKKNSDIEPDQIEKIICEKIVGWGRTRGNEMSIDELVYLDYLETVEEWEDCVQQKMQISLEIGDALMEDISNEMVAEMICH
ncbi:uncharacterized protein LOC116193169 [Punica granatum]|uniref:DUF4378 domain-containing protein n=2 Tax=Punica granatum TaxID=22663 RepID=A0A218X7Y4_PUNGR|nr:uncharacterized protein LOC116193169 [Punica granatum]OWM80621.1 hypothetical protein CDL15_Pgr006651 [Punica granatum]PKI72467.1 hypothetical protein CRG98_007134 [Punica granatum]